jgi:hypothetical protein
MAALTLTQGSATFPLVWRKKTEAATAKKAANELREIAELLEKIEVDLKAQAHPEIATIYKNLSTIRKELGKTVRAHSMSAASRRVVAEGFTNIGRALRSRSSD